MTRSEKETRSLAIQGQSSEVRKVDEATLATVRMVAVDMARIAEPMSQMTQNAALMIKRDDGTHPEPFSYNNRSLSLKPENVNKLLLFLASPRSPQRVLGLSAIQYQPIKDLSKSLRAVTSNTVVVKEKDGDVEKVGKKILKPFWTRILGVPVELVELAESIPQVDFYLSLAAWWAQMAVEQDEALELARNALKTKEDQMGKGAKLVDNYDTTFQKMEDQRRIAHEKIMQNAAQTEGMDLIASLASPEDAAAAMKQANTLMASNADLYRRNNDASQRALDSILNVNRLIISNNLNDANMKDLLRAVENKMKLRAMCVSGVDLALLALQQLLFAGMADVSEYQERVFKQVLDGQIGQVAEARKLITQMMDNYVQGFLPESGNLKGEVIEGDFRSEE